MAENRGRPGESRRKPGVKRERIMDVATEYFGQRGYEDTKWADVATAVGIGSTALYHYFESKQHCLYEIIAETITDVPRRASIASRRRTTTGRKRSLRCSATASISTSATSSDIGSWSPSSAGSGSHRTLPREEAARPQALAIIRDLEFAWGMFLSRGMEQGYCRRATLAS